MRTIKFRAWDKKLKLMAEVLTLSFKNNKIECVHYASNGGVYMFNGEKNVKRYYLMQFTGLKDKNGKEIYEGDIVKLKENEYYFERSGEVIFEEGTFKIKNVELWNDGTYNHYSLEILDTEFCEIIGNIHENKDLIK